MCNWDPVLPCGDLTAVPSLIRRGACRSIHIRESSTPVQASASPRCVADLLHLTISALLQEHLASQGMDVQSVKITGLSQMAANAPAPGPAAVGPAAAAAAAPSAGPTGVDMATVGKGVGAGPLTVSESPSMVTEQGTQLERRPWASCTPTIHLPEYPKSGSFSVQELRWQGS
jgi:hypothetical protein